MIVEQRIYTLIPGKLAEYLEIYERLGWPVAKDHLGKMLGYFYSEVGELNQVIHQYGYESFEERLRKRAAINKHPDWPKYTSAARPLILKQENRLMIPAPFSPIKQLSDW
jgi:hypothetical protein